MIYFNGNYIDETTPFISHRDCSFTTAIGIFDSMLSVKGKLIHLQEHYQRILHDSEIVIGITPTLSLEKFETICLKLLKENSLMKGHARIRTTITGGLVDKPLAPAHTPTILIDAALSAPLNNETPLKCAIITDFPRITGCILENCKRLDYSRSYAARRQAEKQGAEEAILTNTNGNIACGATSNIFIEENGVLITPPLSDGVLAGVTRRKLIEERNVLEESISPDRLKSADKIYLTNSFFGLREITLLIP